MTEKDKLFSKERLKKVADNIGKAAPYIQAANRGILGDDDSNQQATTDENKTIDADFHVVREDKKSSKGNKKMAMLDPETFDKIIWGDEDAKH